MALSAICWVSESKMTVVKSRYKRRIPDMIQMMMERMPRRQEGQQSMPMN